MIRIVFVLFLACSFHLSSGQISGMWHSSCFDYPFTVYGMNLKGKASSWTMTKSTGESRTMTFDDDGTILTDTYTGTIQTFIPPDFMVCKLKMDLEKSHPERAIKDTSTSFNERRQLVERRGHNYLEKNLFDEAGRILIHQQSYTRVETRAWNSIHHAEPTYSYTVNTGVLAFFRYNQHGNLAEISYFHSNPSKNLKMVYLYDDDQHMIETNRYNSYNISVRNQPDDYLDTVLNSVIDTSFSIEHFYPNYWAVGSPSVNKWKYNSEGQKTEYNAYGYRPNGGAAIISFIAKWEYDDLGVLKKEIQYDVWQDRVKKIIEFDHVGNVIKETQVGYDGRSDIVSEMKIVYD